MYKRSRRLKAIIIALLFSFSLFSAVVTAQQPVTKTTAAAEVKRFWKKNELLIGVGSALVFTLIVYAFWRKKKATTKIDSLQ